MKYLALVLCLWAGPVAAQQLHTYEYESVVVGEPVTLTGKGAIEVRLTLPPGVEGLMLSPYLKGCNTADSLYGNAYIDPVIDEDIAFTLVRRHPDYYSVVVLIGDRHRGRTQTYCPRLPYVPHVEAGL